LIDELVAARRRIAELRASATEHDAAAEPLRARQEIQRLALAVATIGDGICITDVEGSIQFVNPALGQMLGYEPEELVGKSVALLYPGGPDSTVLQEIFAGLQSGRWAGEVELLGNNGVRIPTMEIATSMRDETHQLVGYVCVNSDLRERKRAGEELLLRNQELESLFTVARILTTPVSFRAKVDRVLAELKDSVQADLVTLRVPDEDQQGLRLLAQVGLWDQSQPLMVSFDRSLSGMAFQRGEPVVTNDYRSQDFVDSSEVAKGIRSVFSGPIKVNDRALGVINVVSLQLNHFLPERTRLLAAISEQIGVLLEDARLSQELQDGMEQMAIVDEVGRIITSTLDIDQVYEQFAAELKRLVDFDRAVITTIDQGNQSLRLAYFHPPSDSSLRQGQVIPLDGTATAHAASIRRSFIHDDLTESAPFWTWELYLAEGFKSILVVPLISNEIVVGAFGLLSLRTHAYGARDQRIVERLASQIAPAVENALLYQQLKDEQDRLHSLSRQLVEVQEQERRHVARELHDEIGQLLTGLKLTLEVIPRLAEDAGKAKVEQAKTMVNELMVQVRELSLDLRPAMLDDLGLLPTLLWYFERFTARTQVKVTHEHVGLDRRFRPEVETTAYRIVQEALTNVARHADTGAVTVRIRSDQDNLLMDIYDHGAGFDPDAVLANPQSNGLYGMRERAMLLGGQLTLETAPGDGTRLIAELPLGDWPVGDGNATNDNGRENDGDSTGG